MVGMGFRLVGDVIATACHCLPRLNGKVILRDPDAQGADDVLVRVRQPGTVKTAVAAVAAADPCSGLALLSRSTVSGPDIPGHSSSVMLIEDLIAELEPMLVELTPFREGPVFIRTHDKRWIRGTARSSTISVPNRADRIRSGTCGAPVFDADGRVVGLVGSADIRLTDAVMCVLAEQLPGWALRKVCDAQAAPDVPTA